MNDLIHLITPGLDSVSSYFYIMENIIDKFNEMRLVYVPLSPLYKSVEKNYLSKLQKYLFDEKINTAKVEASPIIIDFGLDRICEDKTAFIPSRNLLISVLLDSSTIINHSNKTTISFGFTSDDRVYDSSESFCQTSSSVLSKNTIMKSFVRKFNKVSLVKWFYEECKFFTKEKKKEIILNTYSCYTGRDEECLNCNACFRKSVVLHNLGIKTRPVINKEFLKVRENILSDFDVSKERKIYTDNYIKALRKNEA